MDISTTGDPRRKATAAAIAQLRSRLLDLTARNPLISFSHKTSAGARTHVRASRGPLDALFGHLMDGKQLRVCPLPAMDVEAHGDRHPDLGAGAGLAVWPAAEPEVRERRSPPLQDLDGTFDLRPSPVPAVRHPPRKPPEFQTRVAAEVLERQLAKIRDTARTVAEETGVSTLHVALGFLEWFESEAAEKPFLSPLLLLRVDIDRKIVQSRYEYSICAVGDEIEVNQTLSERLSRDFHIKLSPFNEEDTPASYLSRVAAEVCGPWPRWTVRYFATLAHFPFARLAMFQDLDEAQWQLGLSSHPLLASLMAGRDPPEAMFAAEHDVDAPVVSAKVPVLVLDADASQHSAVFDVMRGTNLVIEGPPGTGKSQTITNIIAAALSNRKSVLFVAEKQAALQVVKNRLDHVGLGDFCLELHSGKVRKTQVLESLKCRLDRPRRVPDHARIDERLERLSATRAALTRYASLLNLPFGATNFTVHQLLWADLRHREGEDIATERRLDSVTLPSSEKLSISDLEERRAALDRFERAAEPVLERFGHPSAHPWRSVTRARLSPVDIQGAISQTAETAAAMRRLVAGIKHLDTYCLPPDASLDNLGQILQELACLAVGPAIPATWLRSLAVSETREKAAAWRRRVDAYKEQLAELSGLLHGQIPTDPRTVASSLHAALSLAIQSIDGTTCLQDLPALAEARLARATELQKAHRTAIETASAFGSAEPTNLREVAVAASALTLVADLPEPVIDAMVPSLLNGENGDILCVAAQAILACRAEAARLDADYSIPPSVDPTSLRQHAAAITRSGFFGFLSPSVKAAKQAFFSLCRHPKKTSRTAAAAALICIAEHLEKVAQLDADRAARGAFGQAYRGLATDVELVLAAIAWARRVRSALSQPGSMARQAREVLLAGTPEVLRSLRSLNASAEQAALRSELDVVPLTAPSFAALEASYRQEADMILALDDACRKAGIPGRICVQDLPSVCSALLQTAAAAEAARVDAALEADLQSTCPSPLDDHASFDAALSLAADIARLRLPGEMVHVLARTAPEDLRSVVRESERALQTFHDAMQSWSSLTAVLQLDEARIVNESAPTITPGCLAQHLERASSHRDELGGWITYLREREIIRALIPEGLLQLWDDRALAGTLASAFDRVFHRALARAAFDRHPELEQFSGLGQDEARARFRFLDSEITELKRKLLADALSIRPIPYGIGVGRRSEYTDAALILAEIGKQKKHIPIRQLLDRAGAAVQALKPCIMMSPLSVSQYLKPDGLEFDLLVIDEASQMRPEDAVGAVARCKQIVVVGDPKQLPPSSFFARSDADDDEDNANDDVDAESILDLAQAVFRPMRRLRWHYRSRHGSLIAFSNRQFYDDDLLIFPSPKEAEAGAGVSCVRVEGLYKQRANSEEVVAVCEAAAQHMRSLPNHSLGIVTMNAVQRELISTEIDRLFAVHADLEDYRDRWSDGLESFFVKNLENVQGDERDVIFVSTVFGPEKPGGRVLQRFGPINGSSGHRRLNVLFTRAKHQLRLFTSMRAEDVLAGPDSSRGAHVLKAFLTYAETGRLEAGVETGGEPDSDFEIFVQRRLQNAGYQIVPQVGVAGFRIDLAVRDPRAPSSFLLGIECDGASYHSSRSARDRDILRQQVLEGLGWKIYRIWSTDWFRDPEGQTRKLVAFIQQALTQG